MKYLSLSDLSEPNFPKPHASRIILKGSTPYVSQFEKIKTGPVEFKLNSIILANLVENCLMYSSVSDTLAKF